MDNEIFYFVHHGKICKQVCVASVVIHVDLNDKQPSFDISRVADAMFKHGSEKTFTPKERRREIFSRGGTWLVFDDNVVKHKSECFETAEGAAEFHAKELLKHFSES